ncbi:MAG TPA: phage baseplate assembly protein V, partial [candidate division Zixibacteria bacterium]|nr:phage baseplate assembly protein V [candidate division Zixibacteria bacterium]
SALFDVGKNVEIYMGYVGDLHPMMLGEITAVNPTFPQSGAPMLAITGYDKSHRMRHNNPARFTFNDMNDSVIAAQIAAENLLIPVVDPAPSSPKSVLQTGSDWSVLQELADRNYFQVYVRWDKLYFRFPRPQTEMVVLEWGQNLSSFSPRLSTSGQSGIQVIRGYDYKLAQNIVSILPAISLGTDLDDIIERLGSGFIDQLMKLGRNTVRKKTADNYPDAAVLAKSILMQLLHGLFEGSGSTIGNPGIRAGDMIEIRGIGKRFSGKYTLSKVTHTINGSGYQTQFEVSQKYTSTLLQSLRTKISQTPSPNQQEKVYGVVIGKVENNVDKEGFGTVQLSFPHLSDINLSRPARVATLMAGGDKEKKTSWGTYFLPDRGDEVLVAFEQGDINSPVVIGSLYNGDGRPPEVNTTGKNEKKVIKSKSGQTIIFDDSLGLKGININNGSNGAARKEDNTKSTSKEDPTFWNWLNGLINVFKISWTPVPNDGGAALKTALTAYLSTNPVPSELTGKIIEGSDSVKIGD